MSPIEPLLRRQLSKVTMSPIEPFLREKCSKVTMSPTGPLYPPTQPEIIS
jgi:hypothetical protein